MVAPAEILSCSDTKDALRTMLRRLKLSGKRGLKDLAEMAGLRSPASMSMILRGQRRLSIESAGRLAQSLHLDRRTSRYLTLLTKKDLLERPNEKLEVEEQLLYLRSRSESHALELSQYRFLSIWYYPAIYAMAATGRLACDAQKISQKLGRGVTPANVKSGIGDLINLGLLKLEGNTLIQTHGAIKTSDRNRSLAVRRYHQEMIRLASESVALPSEKRELSGLTVLVPSEKLAHIKKRICEFRDELNELLTGATEGEVHQINIQLFPLTEDRENNQ